MSSKQAGSKTDHRLVEAPFPLETGMKAVVLQGCGCTNRLLCSQGTAAEPARFSEFAFLKNLHRKKCITKCKRKTS